MRGLAHGPSFQTSVLMSGTKVERKKRDRKRSQKKKYVFGTRRNHPGSERTANTNACFDRGKKKARRGEGRCEKSQKDQSLASHRLCHFALPKFSGLESMAFPITTATLLGF